MSDKISYSRVDCFNQCQYKYYLRYILKLETRFNLDPENALVLGTALHIGIQNNSVEEAIRYYYAAYDYAITDLHINEAIKLEYLIPRVRELLPPGKAELKLEDDDFIGYIDWIDEDGGGGYNTIYDFKYSNNAERYLNSSQLHVYWDKFKQLRPKKAKAVSLCYVMIPKVRIRQKQTETIEEFRRRLHTELSLLNLSDIFKEVDFDFEKVIQFYKDADEMLNCEIFDKSPSKLCDWCDYKRYCESDGKDDSNIIKTIKEGE